MRYDYIDSFVTTALRVLGQTVPGTSCSGEIGMMRADEIRGDVNVLIGITGDSEGDIIISMTLGTARAVTSLLLDEQVASLSSEALDALGELGNMIAGNVISSLNDLGFDFSVTSPRVRVGTGEAHPCPGRETLQVPLSSDCGEMNMHVILGID